MTRTSAMWPLPKEEVDDEAEEGGGGGEWVAEGYRGRLGGRRRWQVTSHTSHDLGTLMCPE